MFHGRLLRGKPLSHLICGNPWNTPVGPARTKRILALIFGLRNQKTCTNRGGSEMTVRRRVRKPDPLASASEIRKVIDDLRRRCPELIPASDRGLFRLMNAVRHIERRPAGDSKSGRPGHFPREKLIEVSRHLKAALAKNYRDRISLSTFIGFCPADPQLPARRSRRAGKWRGHAARGRAARAPRARAARRQTEEGPRHPARSLIEPSQNAGIADPVAPARGRAGG